MEIKITPFCESEKKNIAHKVLIEAKKKKVLPGLQLNCSIKLGFELPLTSEWKNKVLDGKLNGYNCIEYHNARQLLFTKESFGSTYVITGLRSKDNIPYFTDEELQEFKQIINDVVKYA